MATVDVTNQPVVVEATNDVAIVAFTESSVVVEVPNPQPVVEFTAGGTLTAGTGLAGGGYLTGNITLGLSAGSVASLAKADTAAQPGANLSSFVNDLNLATSTVLTDAIAALSTVYQPLNSNLTAIAAVATTVFGRSFLELVDAAASRSLIGVYSTSQVYTKSEVDAIVAAGLIPVWGTITGNILSQADLQMALSAKSSIGHDHVASAITSGIVAPARLGSGTPDNTKFLRGDSSWVVLSGDHGGLTGLGDDDHTQYLNNARGDARYYTETEMDGFLSGLAVSGHTHSYLPLVGGTLSGTLTLPIMLINGTVASGRYIQWRTSGSDRWILGATTTVEGGANVGSNFTLYRYDDAGAYLGAPFQIQRNTGVVIFEATPTVNGTAISLDGHTHAGGVYLPLVGGELTGRLSITAADAHITFYDTDGPDPADRGILDLNSSVINLYGYDNSTTIWRTFFQGNVVTGAFNLIAGTTIGGVGVLPITGANHAGIMMITHSADNQLTRHLELYSDEGTVARPNYLMFHQANRWYSRIQAANIGFAFVGGADEVGVPIRAGLIQGRGTTSDLPTLGNHNASTSLSLRYTSDPTYGLSMGVIGSGNGWIQVQRADGTATPYDLELQPLGGTVKIGGNIAYHAGNSSSIAASLFNNSGQAHGDIADFNSITEFGMKFVQGKTNGPTNNDQFYSFAMGLGSNYAYSSYALQVAFPRPTGVTQDVHPGFRAREGGAWGSWNLMAMCNADNNFVAQTTRGFHAYGSGGNSGITGSHYFWGYQESAAWSHPYPDLVVGYHTGMKMGANTGYGGIRFYTDHPAVSSTEIFSIGNGDTNVRVLAANLFVPSGYGMYVDGGSSVYVADRAGYSYGSIRIGGSKNNYAGVFFMGAYQSNGLMFNTGSNEFGLYSETGGWKTYYTGTTWQVQSGPYKPMPWHDMGGTASSARYSRGTGTPTGGSDGDVYFQYV